MKFILNDIGKRKFGVGESPISANDLYLLVDDSASNVITDYNDLLNLPVLNISDWDMAFSWGNHATAGYLTSFTETDPIFTASPAHGINSTHISNWNSAHSWGNHATVGYLTSFSETDPIFTASPAYDITELKISNWDLAHSWGNHATAGYLTEVDTGVISVTGDLVNNTDPKNPIINSPEIPVNVSEFINDAGYLTQEDLPSPGATEISVQNISGVEQFKITDTVQFGGVVFDALNKRITPSGGGAGPHEHDASDIISGVFIYDRLPISESQVSNWDMAFSWGDHSTMGYLTNIPLFNRTTNGLVPMPGGSTNTRYLREDGTWVTPPGVAYGNMPLTELNTGTSTTGRIVSAKTLNDWINGKGYVSDSGVESVTGTGVNNTDPKNPIINIPTPYVLTLTDLDSVYGYRAANLQDLNNLARDSKFGRGIFINQTLNDFSDVPSRMGTYNYAVARNINGGFIWVQRNAILNPLRFHIYGRLYSEDAQNTLSYNFTSEVAFRFEGSGGMFLTNSYEIGDSFYKHYSSAGKAWSFDANTPDLEFDFWIKFLGYEDEGGSISNITEIPQRSYYDLQDLPLLNLENWDTAFMWGNHAEAGYLTSADVVSISNIIQIPERSYNDLQDLPTLNTLNWDEAFMWGNHAEAGYLTEYDEMGVLSVTGKTEEDEVYIDNTDPQHPLISFPVLPKNVSDLTNDVGYITEADLPPPQTFDQENIVRVLTIESDDLPSISDEGVVEYLNDIGMVISEKEIWVININDYRSTTIITPTPNQEFIQGEIITITSIIE